MISVSFENMYGCVQLFGGENPLMEPIYIEGLAMPEKEVLTAVFKLIEGQKVVNSRDLPRTIVMKGHLFGDYQKAVDAARILYHDGTLTLNSPFSERVIDARCVKFLDRKQLENGACEGEIVFVCDKPYFHDKEPVGKYIYSRVGILKTYFTLPCVISERVPYGEINNLGQVNAEPVIIIKNYGEDTQNEFTIKNLTTNAEISILSPIEKGEYITISIPDRKVVNNRGENLLPVLSDVSYLSDFYLVPGENKLEFSSLGDVRCECFYTVNYTEGIV